MQPWHFCIIASVDKKHAIRSAVATEEHKFYLEEAPAEWLDAVAPLGTDANKFFLEYATLITIFAERYGTLSDSRRVKHYYAPESLGVATGFLNTALHNARQATLTYTPSL